MSMYIGTRDSQSPLLHISKGTLSLSSMKGPPLDTSIIHTDRSYQVLEYVKDVPMSIETLGSYRGWWKYGVYDLGINILQSNDMYIAVGKDLYTNTPILYTQNTSVFTYSGYWAYDITPETARGGYGFAAIYGGGYYDNSFDGVCKYAFALGSQAPGGYTYVAPNFSPSISLYKVTTLNISDSNSINISERGIFFGSTNLFTAKLIGFGPLMNEYAISDSISSISSLFQILDHSSDNLSIERDRIYIIRGESKVELVSTSISYLATSNTYSSVGGNISSYSFSIPLQGFVQLRYLVQVEAPETPSRYITSIITTIDIDTSSSIIRTFGIEMNNANSYSTTVNLIFTRVSATAGRLSLSSTGDLGSSDAINYGLIFITSLKINSVYV